MSESNVPEWLRPMWEEKATETVARVEDAIRHLRTIGARVTLTAICQTVQSLYGRSMSANTILRNSKAYDLYRGACDSKIVRSIKDQVLRSLVNAVSGTEKDNVQAKIQRLRRRHKDSLIADIIRLEQDRKHQADIENALRDELLNTALAERSRAVRVAPPAKDLKPS